MEIQFMLLNELKKKYFGNGSAELDALPRKGDYINHNDKFYLVDRVVISDENMYDVYISETDIEYMESFIDS